MHTLVSKKILLRWLPFALVGTVLLGGVYALNLQTLRLGTNEDLERIVSDISLADDLAIAQSQFSQKTDIERSLSPAVILMDDSQKLISSEASLGNENISPPNGALDYAKKNGENRITWQPQDNIRLATVIKYRSGTGYIIAVRNLREVEKNIAASRSLLIATLGLLLLTSYGAILYTEPRPKS